MRSKWEKSFSRHSSHLKSLFFVFVLAFGWEFSAQAVIFLTPAPGPSGQQNGIPITQDLSVANKFLYYFVRSASGDVTAPASPAFLPSNVILDLRPTLGFLQGTNLNNLTGDLTNSIRIYVRSNLTTTAPSGQMYVITFQPTSVTTSTGNPFIPIAGVGGSACNDQVCQRLPGTTAGSNAPYYAVNYVTLNTNVEVDIDLNQACLQYAANNSQVQITGCDTSGFINPTVGTPKTFSLKPVIYTVPTAIPTAAPTSTASTVFDGSSNAITLNFQSDTPKIVCPPNSSGLYRPKDGQILLNENGIYLSNTGNNAFAPIQAIHIVGQNKTDKPTALFPNVTSTFASTSSTDATLNSVVFSETYIYGDGGTIAPVPSTKSNGGFVNGQIYSVSFILQDGSGLYIPNGDSGGTPTASGCTYDIATAEIAGIFKPTQSSKLCFVATAAFNSADAKPVEMLRDFRDQVLRRFRLGQAFVSWYYSWSPSAAVWLRDHPVMRLPVLLLLAPIEGAAWLFLHPFWLSLYVTISLGMIVILTSFLFWRRSEKNTEGEADEA